MTIEIPLTEERSMLIQTEGIHDLIEKVDAERQELQKRADEIILGDDSVEIYAQLRQMLKHKALVDPEGVAKIYLANIEPLFSEYIESGEMEIYDATSSEYFQIKKPHHQYSIFAWFRFETYGQGVKRGLLDFKYQDPRILEVAGDTILKLNAFFEKFNYDYNPEIYYGEFMFKVNKG
jgi:hypothetical protein